MAGTFKFELVSPERVLVSADADQVVVPGGDGDFAVLAGHAPVVSTLRPGIIEADLKGSRKRLFVKSGFAEVEPDRLTILAERAVEVDGADGARALAGELEAARKELAAAETDSARARARALIERIEALQRA
jgi:F-type H+-transporting ATPase subunit epsilon